MPRCNWIRNFLPLSLLFATIAEALPETFSATYDFIAEGITLGETHYQLENVDNTIYRFNTPTTVPLSATRQKREATQSRL